MKIVVILSRVPFPLEKGDKLRAYHQIRHLAEKHEVMLCCLAEKAVNPEHIAHLKTIVQHIELFPLNRFVVLYRLLFAIFSDKPFQVHYFYQRAIARKMRKAIERFHPDHIYCQLIRCSEYVKNMHQFQKTLDYMDALSSGHFRRIAYAPPYMRFLLRIESKRLIAYEHLIFDYFEHHTIISRQDQQLIHHIKRNTISIIPNGVDELFFSPTDCHKTYDLLITGNMSYPPNVDSVVFLATKVLSLIHQKNPDVRLLIAGAHPSSAIVNLANRHIIVSGWMDDIRDAYRTSRVFVAPLRIGSGMQNKLLEAMSMALPCITSPLAAKGIGEGAEKFLFIAEEPQRIADFVLHLLQDPVYAAERGKAGRDFILEKFNWKKTVQQLESILTQ